MILSRLQITIKLPGHVPVKFTGVEIFGGNFQKKNQNFKISFFYLFCKQFFSLVNIPYWNFWTFFVWVNVRACPGEDQRTVPDFIVWCITTKDSRAEI